MGRAIDVFHALLTTNNTTRSYEALPMIWFTIRQRVNTRDASFVWGLCGKNYRKSAKVWEISQNVEFRHTIISIC